MKKIKIYLENWHQFSWILIYGKVTPIFRIVHFLFLNILPFSFELIENQYAHAMDNVVDFNFHIEWNV